MAEQNPEEGMAPVHAPTDAEMEEGPVYLLVDSSRANNEFSPHGFQYNIQFSKSGEARVYGPHFEQWLSPEWAFKEGIAVYKLGT